MNHILSKTFGGLDNQYYLRHFLFGLIFPVLVYVMVSQIKAGVGISIVMIAFAVINTFLYPYSRFVYERVIGYIMGDNVFFVSAIFMLITKFITMYLCWGLAIFIAPIGLFYLYFYHTKNEINKVDHDRAV